MSPTVDDDFKYCTAEQEIICITISNFYEKLKMPYLGAIYALEQNDNPEKIVHFAHSLREVIDLLTVVSQNQFVPYLTSYSSPVCSSITLVPFSGIFLAYAFTGVSRLSQSSDMCGFMWLYQWTSSSMVPNHFCFL